MATVIVSIGATGRDYSTIEAFEADLDNDTPFDAGDDVIGECYNDSTFDERGLTFNGGGTLGLNSVTLSVASGERHDGTSGTGARMLSGEVGSQYITFSYDVDHTLEWLEFHANDLMDRGFLVSATGTTETFKAQRCLVHDTRTGVATGERLGVRVTAAGSSGTVHLLNNIFYDIGRTSGTGSAICFGITITATFSAGTEVRILNNTVFNTFTPSTDGGNVCAGIISDTYESDLYAINNVVVGTNSTGSSSADDFDATWGDTTNVSHNASEDATAPGASSITTATPGDFVSTVAGSEDLHLASGAVEIDAGTDLGTTPSGVEIDIDDRDRDAEGDIWDMGAHEFPAVAAIEADDIPWFMPVGHISE